MTEGARRRRRARRARAPAWPRATAALAPALLALALYVPSLDHGFARDDHELIGLHPARSGGVAAVPGALISDFHDETGASGKWRPWITLTYAADGLMGGWRPAAFHRSNVVAHAAATAVLALLLILAGVRPAVAALGAAWFAAMAAHVEPVSWIAGRTDLHAGLFVLAALLMDRRRARAGRRGPGILAPALFALALLSKETAVTSLLVLAAAAIATPSGRREAPVRVWLAPYLAVTAMWAAGWLAIGGVPGPPDAIDPERAAAITRGAAWWIPALLRFLVPGVTHAPDWPLPASGSLLDPRIALGLLALGAWLAALIVALRRKSAFAWPLALIVAPLLLPLAGVALKVAGGAVMAERLLYLSSAGVVLCLALAAERLLARRVRAAWAAWALLVAACALIGFEARTTWRDQAMYRDDAALYQSIRARVPDHALGPAGLATVRMREGRNAEALALLEEAEALDPRVPEVHQARAEIAFAEGRWEDAVRSAERTLALEPRRAYPQLLRVAAEVRSGRSADVAAQLDTLAQTFGDDALLLAARGEALLAAGRPAEATRDLERALRAAPGDPHTAFTLARAWRAAGHRDRARAALDHALRLAPAWEAARRQEAEWLADDRDPESPPVRRGP